MAKRKEAIAIIRNEGVPVVVIHMPKNKAIGEGNPAHCFGPFENAMEAEIWEAERNDSCHKIMIEIVPIDRPVLLH